MGIDEESDEFSVQLSRTGALKFIRFFAYVDLGCIQENDNQSFVKILLANDEEITFQPF